MQNYLNRIFGEEVKVGIIGFGSVSRKHIESIRRHRPKSKIFLLTQQVFDPNFIIEKEYYKRTIEEILQVNPDFFVIASSANDHDNFIKEVVSKDVPLLIEKPLAVTKQKAESIFQYTKSSSFLPLVGYNLRFSKAFSFVYEYLLNNGIGDILSFQSVVGQDLNQWRTDRLIDTTPSAIKYRGGGVLRELSHELDYLSVLFGFPKTVSGMLGKQKFKKFDVEDTALINLRYTKNNSYILGSLSLDFTRQDKTRMCNIIGEKGTLRWNLLKGKVTLIMNNEPKKIMYHSPDDIKLTNSRMWEHFINGNVEKFCTLQNALDIMSLIEKIEKEQI